MWSSPLSAADSKQKDEVITLTTECIHVGTRACNNLTSIFVVNMIKAGLSVFILKHDDN